MHDDPLLKSLKMLAGHRYNDEDEDFNDLEWDNEDDPEDDDEDDDDDDDWDDDEEDDDS